MYFDIDPTLNTQATTVRSQRLASAETARAARRLRSRRATRRPHVAVRHAAHPVAH